MKDGYPISIPSLSPLVNLEAESLWVWGWEGIRSATKPSLNISDAGHGRDDRSGREKNQEGTRFSEAGVNIDGIEDENENYHEYGTMHVTIAKTCA